MPSRKDANLANISFVNSNEKHLNGAEIRSLFDKLSAIKSKSFIVTSASLNICDCFSLKIKVC